MIKIRIEVKDTDTKGLEKSLSMPKSHYSRKDIQEFLKECEDELIFK